jgi:hypothetical protein
LNEAVAKQLNNISGLPFTTESEGLRKLDEKILGIGIKLHQWLANRYKAT